MVTPDVVSNQAVLLGRALIALRRSLEIYYELPKDDRLTKTVRSGVIKDFELTYELAVALLYKLVDLRLAAVEKYKPFEVLIKEASELGFIRASPEIWRGYRDMRNRTAHVYDEGLARSVADESLNAYLDDLDLLISKAQQYVGT